jgi:hypothetical protein
MYVKRVYARALVRRDAMEEGGVLGGRDREDLAALEL